MTQKSTFLLSHLVSLLVPLVLIGTAVRVLLTPAFYTLEYNLPHFPVDQYGFTREDRLYWAPFAVEYLVRNVDPAYLSDLKFEDGKPLYNERELSHMEDVKDVVQGTLRLWYFSLAALALLAFASWRGDWQRGYLNGLRRGGWWMVTLAVSLGLIAGFGILINPDVFWQFFTLFHQVFFEGDSWLFYFSDTLIRLFPIRFWQDALLAASAIALGGGLALACGLTKFSRQ